MNIFGSYIMPSVIFICAAIMLLSKNDVFPTFIEGAKSGLSKALSLLPTLVMIVCATKMLSASGAIDFLCSLLSPAVGIFGIPKGVLPVIITRPISAGAANAMLKEVFSEYGADGVEGLAASILMGSTDTLIFTVSMYMSASGTKKTGYAFFAAFLVFLFSTLLSCFLARVFV